jgi:hypothetical protein
MSRSKPRAPDCSRSRQTVQLHRRLGRDFADVSGVDIIDLADRFRR